MRAVIFSLTRAGICQSADSSGRVETASEGTCNVTPSSCSPGSKLYEQDRTLFPRVILSGYMESSSPG